MFKKFDIDYCVRQMKNRRALKIPLILTVRNQKKEGAVNVFSDTKKIQLMQALIPYADWVDIELFSPLCAKLVDLSKASNKKVVISTHNFVNISNNMELLLKKSLNYMADMVKFAGKAKSDKDLIRMIDFTNRHRKSPLTTMCVGPLGAISRLVLPMAGSRWIYTFLSIPTAVGQIDVKTLKAHLDFYYR